MQNLYRWIFVVCILALMAVSAFIAGSTTAKFASHLGIDTRLGWSVGIAFDCTKGLLLLLVASLVRDQQYSRALIATALVSLVIVYSYAATQAAIRGALEHSSRIGIWKSEIRENLRKELEQVENERAKLQEHGNPRPPEIVKRLLEAETVPDGVWATQTECRAIRDNGYMRKACSKVVALRHEFSAAEALVRLQDRSNSLRTSLRQEPPVAAEDPFVVSFQDSLGILIPVPGHKGVAGLLAIIIELASCAGLWLADGWRRQDTGVLLDKKRASKQIVHDVSRIPGTGAEGAHIALKSSSLRHLISEFVRECTRADVNDSVSASDLIEAVNIWCASRNLRQPSPQAVSSSMQELGFAKWKSNGRMRYAGLVLLPSGHRIISGRKLAG